MPRRPRTAPRSIPSTVEPYLRDTPIIRGKPLLPGRKEPTFPAYYLVDEKPVTFTRFGDSQEEHAARLARMLQLANAGGKIVMIVIPHSVYSNPNTTLFHAGWTLVAIDGDIRTHQCVVFLGGEGVPVGSSDQGVICAIARRSLSAWDGRTEEQSRRLAA